MDTADPIAAYCAIDVRSRECVLAFSGEDDDAWNEVRERRLLAVPVSPEVARETLFTRVDDVFALATAGAA